MPIQFDFILRRLSEMARADSGLRGRQPWKAAYERDYGWFGTVITEHYAGDDANVGTLLAGIFAAYEGITDLRQLGLPDLLIMIRCWLAGR